MEKARRTKVSIVQRVDCQYDVFMAIHRTVILPVEFHPALDATLTEASKAYRVISEVAFQSKTYSRYALQKLTYEAVRSDTTLTAQMTCSAIRKVSGAYKSMKSSKRLPDEPAEFSKRCLDLEGGSRGRDFRLYPDKGIVSISTVEGRKKLAYRCGAFQRSYLESPEWNVQAAKLVYKRRRKGWRYELHVTLMGKEPERRAGGVLGVDTGRRYLAVASTGDDAVFFPAGHLKPRKEHFRRLRGKLESKGTRSSARTFARVAGREARLTRDFQNTTAKSLVRLALDSGCGAVAVERLNGIREHTGTRDQKARYHHSTWAYARFLDILRHKAEGAGLELIEVDPANTSRTCCACRCVDKASRKGLSFSCTQCSYSPHADANAARNIRLRAILQRQAPLEDGAESCAPKADSGSPKNGKLPASAGST
jgi:IS605 OrfB family transposase